MTYSSFSGDKWPVNMTFQQPFQVVACRSIFETPPFDGVSSSSPQPKNKTCSHLRKHQQLSIYIHINTYNYIYIIIYIMCIYVVLIYIYIANHILGSTMLTQCAWALFHLRASPAGIPPVHGCDAFWTIRIQG